MGSLDQRVKLYLGESRKLLPDLESTYDQLVARIQANGADVLVPAVGDRLPEFLMTDSHGQLVDLDSLLWKGPVVISFNRGPWCDYCGLELHALARAYPDIVAAGGDVVSIVPETAKYAEVLKQTRGLPFRVLTDLDLAYALSLGLVFWVGDKIKETYRQFGIDLEQFQGNGGWLLPIPATTWSVRMGASRPGSSTPTSAIAWESSPFCGQFPAHERMPSLSIAGAINHTVSAESRLSRSAGGEVRFLCGRNAPNCHFRQRSSYNEKNN